MKQTRKRHNNIMKERIVSFEKSSRPEKKYMANVKDLSTGKIRVIHFGASDYQQYKDRTGLGFYTKKNHGDIISRYSRYFYGSFRMALF